MSLAAETREAVRRRPILYDALRAGIVNYTAAAGRLDLDGDREAVATALRRFAESLSEDADHTVEAEPATDRSLTVRMNRGVDPTSDSLPVFADDAFASDNDTSDGDNHTVTDVDDNDATDVDNAVTAIHATGDVDSALLATVLDRLRIAEIDVLAAGVAVDSLVVLVAQRAGVDTLRVVEGVA